MVSTRYVDGDIYSLPCIWTIRTLLSKRKVGSHNMKRICIRKSEISEVSQLSRKKLSYPSPKQRRFRVWKPKSPKINPKFRRNRYTICLQPNFLRKSLKQLSDKRRIMELIELPQDPAEVLRISLANYLKPHVPAIIGLDINQIWETYTDRHKTRNLRIRQRRRAEDSAWQPRLVGPFIRLASRRALRHLERAWRHSTEMSLMVIRRKSAGLKAELCWSAEALRAEDEGATSVGIQKCRWRRTSTIHHHRARLERFTPNSGTQEARMPTFL